MQSHIKQFRGGGGRWHIKMGSGMTSDFFANQVLQLSRDPTRCRALGTSGRHYVLTHFDRQVLARKLTDVMQHVTSNG
ncbi:hypothetical protein NSPZN2_40479 [Nitrospira defluvii]|uniref:Uncharacterized protein n=1 Tax=Nitrospira defluvii TaxID=330214 RepID=A0ABN7LY80_9BACT|nr:hypothetical protein NSPZN2_40479 [Nitrospira defluvii]